ncbi:hypothetical protein D9611_005282 [Ephemerocybe angulata]|uniref:Gfd2/YDR514C-like C-terminal domain-containing protein n=1 Tax=Ephemerocybe angulata TaxID=980116 RepID=A0A8H5BZU8_9AGAR|nr:hypothetical protein D9611_005282 [Tulosesus angulatus]
MNNDFVLVDPKAWEYDLHSIYSAYIGYFQVYNIPWYERSWGHFFESFDGFLGFTWPVITVTDAWTGKPHIATRLTAINSFIKMIKTRFGETLPQPPNILQITPFETSQRRQRHVSDYVTYSRLHATLPAAYIAAVKARVRAGDYKVVLKELWEKRDKTFLAIDFEWNERNERTVMEWGYAALRCGHLEALGHWPPSPDQNYRKGHYIVSEYVDKIVNRHTPTHPWQVNTSCLPSEIQVLIRIIIAFGDSQAVSKTKLPDIIETIISSLASPDSETALNTLVLVAHGVQGDLARLEEMKIKLPSNMVVLDTAILERAMYSSGHRPIMMDPKTEKPRVTGTTLSLENLLISFTLPPLSLPNGHHRRHSRNLNASDHSSPERDAATPSGHPGGVTPSVTVQPVPIVLPQCKLHNAGNDAFMTLFAFQQLMEPHVAHKTPSVKQQQQMHSFPGSLPTPPLQNPTSPGSYLNPLQSNGGGGGMGMSPRPRVMSHQGSGMGWPMVPVPVGMGPMGPLSPPINMTMNGSAAPLMVPAFSTFGMQQLGGGYPGGSNGQSLTLPGQNGRGHSGERNGVARPKSAVYDLAGEFGNLSVPSRSGSSGPDSLKERERERKVERVPMMKYASSPGLGKSGN